MKIAAKKVLVAAIFAVSLATGKDLTLGAGLSINSMNLSENDDVDSSARFSPFFGFHGGVGLEFPVSPAVYLSTGLYFCQRGQEFGGGSANPEAMDSQLDATFEFLFLQFPLHFGVNLNTGSNVSFRLFGGPELGIALDGKATFEGEINGIRFKATSSIDTSPFDFGLTAGAGIRFHRPTFGLYLEPSYYFGLVDVAIPEDDPDTFEDESDRDFHSQTRSFQVRAGLFRTL